MTRRYVRALPDDAHAMRVRVHRSGEVAINPAADRQFQCGETRPERFYYRAIIDANGATLDHATGFLVDHMDIHAALVKLAASFDPVPSCEVMALAFCDCVRDLIGPDRLLGVTVEVADNSKARWMSATWPLVATG
jgi:hypothetical protein